MHHTISIGEQRRQVDPMNRWSISDLATICLCVGNKKCLTCPKCYICNTYSPRGPPLPWIFPHEWPQVGIPILPPNPRGRQGATRIGLPRMRAAAKSCARSALNAKIAKTVFVLIISKVLPIFFWCFPVCFTDGLLYQKCTWHWCKCDSGPIGCLEVYILVLASSESRLFY